MKIIRIHVHIAVRKRTQNYNAIFALYPDCLLLLTLRIDKLSNCSSTGLNDV